jgi:microcompartment protein CcmK/EutM
VFKKTLEIGSSSGVLVSIRGANEQRHYSTTGTSLNIMILGKVVGTIVTTISHPHYKNRRLLVVQPLVMDGEQPEPNEDFIALDNTQAGIGDTVLVNREGNGARQVLKIADGAVISVIVGIVDSVYVEG